MIIGYFAFFLILVLIINFMKFYIIHSDNNEEKAFINN